MGWDRVELRGDTSVRNVSGGGTKWALPLWKAGRRNKSQTPIGVTDAFRHPCASEDLVKQRIGEGLA